MTPRKIPKMWCVYTILFLWSTSIIPEPAQAVKKLLPLTVPKITFTPPPNPTQADLDAQNFKDFQKVISENKKEHPKYNEFYKAALGRGGKYAVLGNLLSGGKAGIELDHAPPVLLVTRCLPTIEGLSGQFKEWADEKIILDKKLVQLDNLKQSVNTLTKEMERFKVERLKGLVEEKDYVMKKTDNAEYNTLKDQIRQMAQDPEVKDGVGVEEGLKQLEVKSKKLAEDYFKGQTKFSPKFEQLLAQNPEQKDKIIEDLTKLQQLKAELRAVKDGYSSLDAAKEGYKERVMKQMAVLSIPHDVHMLLPTSSNRGFNNNKYDGLMEMNGDEVGREAEKRFTDWSGKVKGIIGTDLQNDDATQRIFNHYEDALMEGKKPGSKEPEDYDVKILWKDNFAEFLKVPVKRTMIEGELGKSYAKWFMANAIALTKKGEFKKMISEFINEYAIAFGKEEFPFYKEGIKEMLKINQKLGWIDKDQMKSLIDDHKLETNFEVRDTALDKTIKERIDLATADSDRGLEEQKVKPGTACASSKARSGEGCIFSTEPKEEQHQDEPEERNIFGDVVVLEDDEKVNSIDARKLSDYLSGTQGDSYEEAREREAIVDLASKHMDKLEGDEETVKLVKAQIGLDMTEMHHDKHQLARMASGGLDEEDSVHPKVLPKYTKVKASPSKIKEFANKVSQGTGNVAKYYGKVMLGNGIVSSLRAGDYKGLSVMGGRISIDAGFEAAEKLGKFMVSKASSKLAVKIGSGMSEIVGKIGGPIGGVADIGIDIWSMTSSIKSLQDPRATRWEQNDAIADITADSIDIAVTATSVILSIALPPLAPIIAAVGFIINLITSLATAIVRAIDRVNELDSEIHLLPYERTDEGIRAFFGEDVSLYLKELIDIKKANNQAVNATVLWLRDNNEYIGKVWPSSTLNTGTQKCKLVETECHLMAGCFSRSYDCQGGKGSWCPGINQPCEDHGSGGNYGRRCECEPAPEVTWTSEDEPDSYVDFRNTQDLYPYRAEPDFSMPSGYSYKCRPNSKEDRGEQISKRDRENAYLCDHAIGIEHYSQEGKYMLYDLREGTDTLWLNENENMQNIILVNDGRKQFNGNGGDDIFILEGPCSSLSGSIFGGPYKDDGNVLIVSGNCSSGNMVNVNLASSYVTFGSSGDSLALSQFERIFGRHGISDMITGNCDTKFIAGGGGWSNDNPDKIVVPGSCGHIDITVVAEGHTDIEVKPFNSGDAYILVNDSISDVHVSLPSTDFQGQVVLRHGTGQLMKVEKEGDNLAVYTDQGGVTKVDGFFKDSCDANKKSPVAVVWGSQSYAPFQIVPVDPLAQANFVLDKDSTFTEAWGTSALENIFHIKGGIWNIHGSSRNDTFYIQNWPSSGTQLDGGDGNNVLVLGYAANHPDLRLFSGELRVGDGPTIKGNNIQVVVGQKNNPERVYTACSTRLLDLGGGTNDEPDMVFVHDNGGCEYDLSVLAKGNTYVENGSEKGKLSVFLGPPDNPQPTSCGSRTTEEYVPANFEFTNNQLSKTQVNVIINREPKELSSFHYSEVNKQLKLQVGDDKLSLSVLPIPDIFFKTTHSRTLITQMSDSEKGFVAVHTLLPNDWGTHILPLPFISNQFLLTGGSWFISSKENQGKPDSLLIDSKDVTGSYEGSPDGSSTVVFTEKVDGFISVGEDGKITLPGGNTIRTNNIGQWQGRPNQAEHLNIDVCKENIGLINLAGGRDQSNTDQIIVFGNCNSVDRKTVILAPGYTMCQIMTGVGSYEIHAKPLKSGDTFAFDGTFELHNSSSIVIPMIADPTQLSLAEILPYEKEVIVNLKFKDSSTIGLTLVLKDGLEKEDFIPSSRFNALFVSDNYDPLGNLLIRLGPKPEILILHNLEDQDSQRGMVRRGVATLRNTFRVNGSNWEVHGGNLDDTLILNTDKFNGMIQGHGGINTLILDSFSGPISIDLLYNQMSTPSTGSEGGIAGIEIVNGREGQQELVTSNCFTKLLKLEGGPSPDSPDTINIPHLNCDTTLTIIASSNTKIVNSALTGNFSYLLLDPKTLEVSYNLGPNINHVFNFPVEMMDHVSMSPDKKSLIINFQGVEKQFPITPLENQPIFQLRSENEDEGTQVISSLWVENDNDDGEGQLYPSTSTYVNTSFVNVKGLDGARNHIVVLPNLQVDSIQGGSADDFIYVTGNSVVGDIHGMGGDFNTLQISDSFWPKVNLLVDLRNGTPGGMSVIPQGNRVVSSISNITIFNGRKSLGQEDQVVLSCETLAVTDAERIYIRERDCVFNTRITVGQGTRVLFQLYDQYVDEDTDILDSAHSDVPSQDTYPNISRIAPDSTFYYHLSDPMSFSVEIDDYSRLEDTQHYLYLNVSLGDIKTIQFEKGSRNLSYTLLSDQESPDIYFKHQMFPLSIDDMFYPQPRIMTSDGFQIVIDKYEQIYLVFSNPDETLDPNDIRNTFIPTLARTSSSLKSIFMIDTGSDFLYTSNPDKPALLSNKENVTSHLLGWNGTTYYILQGNKDVYVYPQEYNDLIQVIDVTNIMRNEKGEMLPHPDVRFDPLDQHVSPGTLTLTFKDRAIFSGVLKIANARKYQGNLRFLFGSVAHQLLNQGGQWIFQPTDIQIPAGYVYQLSAGDLNDDVFSVVESEPRNAKGVFTFSKWDNDLIVSNMDSGNAENGEFCSFVFHEFYNSTSSKGGVNISLGNSTVHAIPSDGSLKDGNGNQVNVKPYREVLTEMQNLVLQTFPTITVDLSYIDGV